MKAESVYFITFRSVTYAQRGERVLRRAGFRCGIQRTGRRMAETGCGYSLRLQTQRVEQAMELLRAEGLPYGKVYLLHAGGDLEDTGL